MERKFEPGSRSENHESLFGLPYSLDESSVVVLPVPWDATTSYGHGTCRGPELVLKASQQVDLFDLEVGRSYEKGYFMPPVSREILELNEDLRRQIISTRHGLSPQHESTLNSINKGCSNVNSWVYEQTQSFLKKGKMVGVLGGDHSTPLGLIQALSEKYAGDFGILHVDAHADLRDSYEGFTYSHASIMHNVMNASWSPKKLVQVGIRDFSEEEFDQIKTSRGRIKTFFDLELKERLSNNESWAQITRDIVEDLPENVYISFDIDGLDPNLCPGTGTPVPGGLQFHEATHLIKTLHLSGRRIIGFDLNEVSGGSDANEWNGNVGARLLFKLCGWASLSHSNHM